MSQSTVEEIQDWIFETFDTLLSAGKFNLCDDIISSIDVEKLPVHALRAILVMTLPAKNIMTMRVDFYNRAWDRTLPEKGEKVTKRLLGRLQ